jgi:HK97 family phage prohead protease/HK97 family phage major capsid protein
MEADFSGYATKADIKCSDGRTILSGAFKHQDSLKVPLVWQHGHSDPENVLGHAILEHRDDGMYAYAFFNKSAKADHARSLVEHGDITKLSIWANELVERAGKVLHGAIREVSLVLSGANPGANIENVTIRHSDGDESFLEDEAIIQTGLDIEHEQLVHAEEDGATDSGKSVEDIYNSMDQEQKDVLHYMVGEALQKGAELAGQSDEVTQDNVGEAEDDKTLSHENSEKEGSDDMTTRNIFESGSKKDGDNERVVLSHADMEGIVADATKNGSLKTAVEGYALSHGINQIDVLFPEAQALTTAPEFYTRRQEWVNSVLSGARKSPFSRVKTHWADLTYDDARAKGYITGEEKQEEFYGTARRETNPQTIYKKQKLDRDDILDITDFDVVAWMKGEMRLMLDEELARAILVGDGRTVPDPDKILEDRIRPIAKDDPMFAIPVLADYAASGVEAVVDAIISYRAKYRGSGIPTMYTSEALIASIMLLKDTLGRRIYTSLEQFASEIRVAAVVPVDIFDPAAGAPLAIIVNMSDYVIGSDKGGNVTLFDDFDIDFNQYKYLIETRCSGALVKLKSALVVKQGTFVPATPGTDHIIVPEPPNARQSVPPVHGSLPNAATDDPEGGVTSRQARRQEKSE